MFILTRYTGMLESSEPSFQGPRGTAEFVFMFGFGIICLLFGSWMVGGTIPFLASGLSFMVLYVWSRKSPYRQVSFWGFGFLAWHLPFVLLAFGSSFLSFFFLLSPHITLPPPSRGAICVKHGKSLFFLFAKRSASWKFAHFGYYGNISRAFISFSDGCRAECA